MRYSPTTWFNIHNTDSQVDRAEIRFATRLALTNLYELRALKKVRGVQFDLRFFRNTQSSSLRPTAEMGKEADCLQARGACRLLKNERRKLYASVARLFNHHVRNRQLMNLHSINKVGYKTVLSQKHAPLSPERGFTPRQYRYRRATG